MSEHEATAALAALTLDQPEQHDQYRSPQYRSPERDALSIAQQGSVETDTPGLSRSLNAASLIVFAVFQLAWVAGLFYVAARAAFLVAGLFQ